MCFIFICNFCSRHFDPIYLASYAQDAPKRIPVFIVSVYCLILTKIVEFLINLNVIFDENILSDSGIVTYR